MMLGLAKYRKNVGNSLVKERNWEAALLCYINGLYLLKYAQVAEGKNKPVGAPSTGEDVSRHFSLEKARLGVLVWI